MFVDVQVASSDENIKQLCLSSSFTQIMNIIKKNQ